VAAIAIVTDPHRPHMDGFELIERIRAAAGAAHVPIIVVSGEPDPGHALEWSAVSGRTLTSRNPNSPTAERKCWNGSCMRILRRRLKIFLVLLFPLCRAQAQTAPDLQQIFQRLDRLEGENRELREQLRQLREQISPGAPAAAQTPTPEERVDIEERRTAEQAQTKVESSQHFPLRVTGTALVNAFNNSKQNGGVDYPTVASVGPARLKENAG